MPDTVELQRINSALQVLVQQMAKIAYALETIAHVQNPSFKPLETRPEVAAPAGLPKSRGTV